MKSGHNYHHFTGWRLIVLLVIFSVYTGWFTTIGPFGELTRLDNYDYLQGRWFYTGSDAVIAIEGLNAEGRRLKYTALGFDLVYMILQTWVFEALIAFGLAGMGLMASKWRWILLAPMGFLLFDFLEDSALALVMTTSSELIGSFAGGFTLMKFVFFVPLVFISLGIGVVGLVTKILRKRNGET